MRLPNVELRLSRPNVELFDDRLASIMSGELREVKSQVVTIPGDESAEAQQAQVAIKSCIPVPNEKLVLIGLARYENGRVVGEAHTQPIYDSPYWDTCHVHARALCVTFERRGSAFPPSEKYANNVSRLRDEGALGASCFLMRWMATVGSPVHDYFQHPRARRVVERLQLDAREPLFVNPIFQYAINPDNR